jgi:hypothetical protein
MRFRGHRRTTASPAGPAPARGRPAGDPTTHSGGNACNVTPPAPSSRRAKSSTPRCQIQKEMRRYTTDGAVLAGGAIELRDGRLCGDRRSMTQGAGVMRGNVRAAAA